ncbi:hypothetical protein, conserved [Babesia bigemina]|uniref:Uncharacterized protein n=1 Tax=Babesia bigemina TaxID=5866 RepID=A0A061D958_BABBI|nr:hypothetical protein, conserved [Babesia bigemina]CDR94255.1 hypothetical protein, conserved [Babesia bigemina]|eukprot:XP_012766441.1 hypothetical protein, conserved [Babesia bigemina]
MSFYLMRKRCNPFIIYITTLSLWVTVTAFRYCAWNPNSLTSIDRSLLRDQRVPSVVFLPSLVGSNRRISNLRMIWCYPIVNDGPGRRNRHKVNQAFERGPTKVNLSLTYEYANRLAQNQMFAPFSGLLPFYPEEGLGRTQDVYTPVESACGRVDIDIDEFEKIKDVYRTFNDQGCGVLELVGAKGGHFAFKYCGPLKEKYGIKAYLSYLLNVVYPGAKVTILTEHAVDEVDRIGVDPWLYAKQRRLICTGSDYTESFNDGKPHEMSYPKKFDMLV